MSRQLTGTASADSEALDLPAQAALAQRFRLLHTSAELLILPNA